MLSLALLCVIIFITFIVLLKVARDVELNPGPYQLLTFIYWTPDSSQKSPMKMGPFFHPSFCPGIFLGLYHKYFPKFGMVIETHITLHITAGSSRKNFLFPKLGKWTKNRVF